MNEKATRQLQSYTQNTGFFNYAVKKTERLARAIYLITNFFSDNEPIKWSLRSESLDLLENFSRLTDSVSGHSSVDVSLLKNSLKTSLATLGVAHTGGLISEMNFSILRHEFEELLADLENELGGDGKHSPLLFPKDFFNISGDNKLSSGTERYLYGTTFDSSTAVEKKTPIDTAATPTTPDPETQSSPQADHSEKEASTSKGHSGSIKDIKDIKRTPVLNTTPANNTPSRTNRREIILQLVKDRKEISVKDAAREVQDVSEKTLQREIIALVNEGVLERVGSRRWSRYRFAAGA